MVGAGALNFSRVFQADGIPVGFTVCTGRETGLKSKLVQPV